MIPFAPYAAPTAILTAIIGTILVVHVALRIRRGESGWRSNAASVFTCPVCQTLTDVNRDTLQPLEGAELALAVRAMPAVHGRPLSAHICAFCGAELCFAVDKRPPEFIGANLSSPQQRSGKCANCGCILMAGPIPRGDLAAPGLPGEQGLLCSRCDEQVCVKCARAMTREGLIDGAYRCPRCFKVSVDRPYTG